MKTYVHLIAHFFRCPLPAALALLEEEERARLVLELVGTRTTPVPSQAKTLFGVGAVTL